jgi:hypothetical protein
MHFSIQRTKDLGRREKIIIYKLEGGRLELMNQNGSAIAFIEELHECRLN